MTDEVIFNWRTQYAGFWPRLGARIVDGLLLRLFVGIPLGFIYPHDHAAYFLVQLIELLAFYFYRAALHATKGATLGKKLLKLKVVASDLQPIGWKEALKRESVEFGIAMASFLMLVWAVGQVDISVLKDAHGSFFFDFFFPLSREQEQARQAANKILLEISYTKNIFGWVMLVWEFAVVATINLNEKRRAVHDIIAGTAVVLESKVQTRP